MQNALIDNRYKTEYDFIKLRLKRRSEMVKHIILWTLKEEYSVEQKDSIKAGMKEGLESLRGQIPGLIDIQVNINALASSNAEVILDSTFEDEAALRGYAINPAHVEVANTKVRPFTASRTCMDYEA